METQRFKQALQFETGPQLVDDLVVDLSAQATKPLKECKETLNFFRKMLGTQRNRSKQRGHPPPDYTLDELISWLEEQPHLTDLWEAYQASGHNRMLAPSIDRLDDNLPYRLDNIRLVTWQQNCDAATQARREGRLPTGGGKKWETRDDWFTPVNG